MNSLAVNSPARRPNLDIKLKVYNEYHRKTNNPTMMIETKEDNGGQLLIGVLKVHWGDINQQIQLIPEDNSPVTKRDWRRSTIATFPRISSSGGLSVYGNGNIDLKDYGSDASLSVISPEPETPPIDDTWQKTLVTKGNAVTVKRIDRRHQNRSHRRSIINGHIFNVDTSVFKPVAGSVATVTITSACTTPQVIRQLFDKFRVLNDPSNFCLCITKSNGERQVLRKDDFPLVQKILLGPIEEESKIMLMEKQGVQEVSPEVAPFFILPEAVLMGFLDSLQKEQSDIEATIRARYQLKMRPIIERIAVLEQDGIQV